MSIPPLPTAFWRQGKLLCSPGVWDWISLYLPIITTAPRMTGFLFMKISRSFRGLNGHIIRDMPVFWAQNRFSALLFSPLLWKKQGLYSWRQKKMGLSVSSTIPSARWFPGNGIFLCPSTVWRYGMVSCPSGMKRPPSGGISSFAPAGSCRLPEAVIIIVPVFWAASPCPASVCMPLPDPGRIC